jgi:hypothetical protein
MADVAVGEERPSHAAGFTRHDVFGRSGASRGRLYQGPRATMIGPLEAGLVEVMLPVGG